MRETRVLCRSIRTRSPAWYVNKRLRPCRDAAIFRAYETRALKARRDRFARRYAADVIARASARTNIYQCSAGRTRGTRFLLENPRISAGSSSKRRNRRMDRDVVCARAIYRGHIRTHTYSHSHVTNDGVPSRRTRFCATISLPGPSTPLSLASPLARHRF